MAPASEFMPLASPIICLVTDRRQTDPSARTLSQQLQSLDRLLDQAIEAGIPLIQIRERDLEARPLGDLVERTSRRAESSRTTVVVNDRIDVAATCGASGVHLRDGGPPAARVRSLLATRAVVGRSVHAAAQATEVNGYDYVMFGPVFPSQSKPVGWRSAGLGALAAFAAGTTVPTIAVGGVTAPRAAACLSAGARGVAAIGLFLPPGLSGGLGPGAAMAAIRAALGRSGV